MATQLAEALEILSRTPDTLTSLVQGLSPKWLNGTEGPETWSPYDVVGHMVNAETTNWMVRLNIILDHGESKPFTPFDRFAHKQTSQGKSVEMLLQEFARLRQQNMDTLRSYNLTEADFETLGQHPEFGQVKLGELLATWVVHDLSHIRQIVRVMAKQYTVEVGPWQAYLPIFKEGKS
ncbi:MAG: DinB family protein [Deinococcota bacterium]